MLSRIKINSFLYLKEIDIELSEGLNVFTGETGVGKSLIVDAVEFVLGKKGGFEDGSYVELVFENVNSSYAEDGMVILAREVKKGKNYYYINGRRATLSALKEASDGLIIVHSQHQHQSLFRRDSQREILDSYAQIDNLIKEYQKQFEKLKQIEKKLEYLKNQQSNRLRELDILQFQLEELEEADLKEGEKEQLESRYRYLTNVSLIKEAVFSAENILSEDEDSVSDKIAQVLKELTKVSSYAPEINDVLSALEEAKAIIDDAVYQLSRFDIDVDFQELSQIEERLNLINRLETKYNTDEKGLIELKRQFRERVDYLKNLEFELPEIEKERERVYADVQTLADQISQIRREKAKLLEEEIKKHLKELALKEAQFVVKIEEKPLDRYGKDSVYFYFSANRGFEPQPVDEVASGGEISRLSLALKLVVGSDVDCLVFDEVDTGIGGKTAVYLAEKLKKLSQDYQVILITHLPQVAVYGDRHFYIDKVFTDSETVAVVKQLSSEDRVKEIARMLSGKTDRHTLNLAKQLLESVR